MQPWSCNILNKIGDGCGCFVGVDEETVSTFVLRWARILVRVKGRSLPKYAEVDDDSYIFLVQLWWKISPCVGKKRGDRVSQKSAETEVREELHGASRVIERVERKGKRCDRASGKKGEEG